MKNYGNKKIAKVGFYLVASDGRRGFALTDKEGVTYEELYLDTNVENRPYNCVSIGGVFQIKRSENMKRDLVNLLFSNDDQIAIILNKENDEEDAEMFEFMQGWREWFGDIVKKIKALMQGRGTKDDPYVGWAVGMPVEINHWYQMKNGDVLEALESGIPASEIDTDFFDITD